MKNPKNIFPHLFSDPSRLLQYRCLQKLTKLLPTHLQEMVLYTYIKGTTLYFVLKHPGYAMEINYNKTLIKELLTILQNRDKNCSHITIKQIKTYDKFIPLEKKEQTKSYNHYHERASGAFSNSENFSDIFLKIKEAIEKNANS